MALPSRLRPKRAWFPWARLGVALVLTLGAAWGILEFGQRYLGLQKLTIEQVVITGCRGERLVELQKLADQLCLGKPLFWFDADKLRSKVEEKRWVKGLLIRKDPPDRLSLVVEERKPLLWLVRTSGVYLVSDDGIVMDRVDAGNLQPIPVVADPASQTDETFLKVLRAAIALRNHQRDFYERLSELRWSAQGPVAYLEGLKAPLYLSRHDPTRNVPNFQGIYLSRYADADARSQVRYFDLRWDVEGGYVAVGDQDPDQSPVTRTEGK